MTGLSEFEASEEAGNAGNANEGNGSPDRRTEPDDAQLQKLTGQLKSALIGLDRGRALFIAVSALVGDNPDQELAVVDPETGRVLAYLLPAAQRHAVFAAARRSEHTGAKCAPPRTLTELLVGGVNESVS